jgi:hypothetical protein
MISPPEGSRPFKVARGIYSERQAITTMDEHQGEAPKALILVLAAPRSMVSEPDLRIRLAEGVTELSGRLYLILISVSGEGN